MSVHISKLRTMINIVRVFGVIRLIIKNLFLIVTLKPISI